MARTSICNIRIDTTEKTEFVDVLSRFYGYQDKLPGGDGLIDNPETKDDFVKRMILREIKENYRAQKKIELTPNIVVGVDVA